MADLYVYYKVPTASTAQLLPQVRRLQQSLATRHGVSVALKRRPDASDGIETWMEVYGGADPVLVPLVQAGTDTINAMLASPRRCEVFVDIAPCA
jgi:hypothetical protein